MNELRICSRGRDIEENVRYRNEKNIKKKTVSFSGGFLIENHRCSFDKKVRFLRDCVLYFSMLSSVVYFNYIFDKFFFAVNRMFSMRN